jgi:hypothetical protein
MSNMKHAELIRAALDGKTIQIFTGFEWCDMESPQAAIAVMCDEQHGDYRIKPGPQIVERWFPIYVDGDCGRAGAHKGGSESAGARHMLHVEFDIRGETPVLVSAAIEKA